MYPVIQIQFLDGLWNRLLGTRRSAIGHFFPISPVTVPEAFAKPIHTARGPFLESPGNFTGPKSNIQIKI